MTRENNGVRRWYGVPFGVSYRTIIRTSHDWSEPGGNWTRYAETLEEAFAVTDAVYDPKNPQLRQEIIETIDPATSEWRFRGGSAAEWSRPTRRRQAG